MACIRSPRANQQDKWPSFLFDMEDGTPEFIEEIKKAVIAFRFEELPKDQQFAYKLLRKHGRDYTFNVIEEVAARAQQKIPKNLYSRQAVAIWALTLGQLIFDKVPPPALQKLSPFNDARFLPVGNNIVVEFRSLTQITKGNSTFWHSCLKPQVEIGEKKYTVAFSKHVIKRIRERINPRMTYGALGDVYAYLEECTFFEPCQLLNTRQNGTPQTGITFYDACVSDKFWNWQYITDVLGEDNLDPRLGKPYHRVGYCPAFLDEEGGFINLATLLFPGYRSTPEYGLIINSSLAQEEKDKLSASAINQDANTLLTTGDFSILKWFHENGVPQVIQTLRPIYQTFPKQEFRISEIIHK